MTRTRKNPSNDARARSRPPASAIKAGPSGKKTRPAPKTVAIGDMQLHPTPILDTFFKFVTERHAIHERRLAGGAAPWTADPILANYPFTNVFRVFDRVTQYILQNVIACGDQSLEEQCFRLMLFRSFNKEETWELLEEHFGELTWRDFDIPAYEEVLLERQRSGHALYGHAYIIPSPKLGAQANASNHLRLIEMMMEAHLPKQLQTLEHLRDAHGRICLFPGMGDFTALQLLLDLNMTAHFNYSEDDWVALGPGSLECLRKMFGPGVRGRELDALRYLHRTQHAHFKRLATPPGRIPRLCAAATRGLSMVDIEHALCECEKYSRAAHPSIQGRRQQVAKRAFVPREGPITAAVPAHWLDPESRRQHTFTYPPPDVVNGEALYEVSHIVAEKKSAGTTAVNDPSYLVRWVGYGPSDDTWERRSVLAQGAPLVIKQWDSVVGDIQTRTLAFQDMGPEYSRKTKRQSSSSGSARKSGRGRGRKTL